MRGISKRGQRGLAALASGALALGVLAVANSESALADAAPGSSDVVGVGSDTLQYMLDFGADGDNNGHGGYNVGKSSRIFSFDATPDANARAGYLNGSTTAANLPLNPTIVLRAGASPRQRPNGSGAGITALALDSDNNVQFARSSSAESQGNVDQAHGTGGVGDLHEVRLAKDSLSMASGTTTNAVPLTAAQLKQVYLCASGFQYWDEVGGTVHQRIVPVIPQASSGTRKTFLTDIGFTTDSSGNVTQAVGNCVQTYEENDPYALFINSTVNGDGSISSTAVTDPYVSNANANANAIEPMSGGRLNLYSAGYFYNPNTALGKGTTAGDDSVLSPNVKLLSTANSGTYNDVRGLYVIFRESDITSGTKFNGTTKNWVNTLFLAGASGGTPYFNSPAGKTLITSAGVTPDFADCGKNAVGAGACGPL